MGLLNRLIDRFSGARASSRGSALEAQGRLEEAYELYQAAGQGEPAARVMLARAEAEPEPQKRLALLALAASAAPGSPIASQARRRKALLSLDLIRTRPGSLLDSELRALARELENEGSQRDAAEVLGLVGDLDGQARLLAACGAIDALESAFDAEQQERGTRRERQQFWNQTQDTIALGQRSQAIRMCESWLIGHPTDNEVRTLAKSTRERLVTGPCLQVRLDDEPVTIALGEEVCVGRSDSTIVLPSPVLSRRHLLLDRGPKGARVSDLKSRNGTLLAGARLDGPIEVGSGLQLSLGGQIPCRIEPMKDGSMRVVVADQRWIVPLGPMPLGLYRLVAQEACVQLQLGEALTPPVLNGLAANVPIDLCRGDELRERRDGRVLLKVLGS